MSAHRYWCGGSPGKTALVTGANSFGNSVSSESSTSRVRTGTANSIDVGLIDSWCRDKDGCLVIWDRAGHPGAVGGRAKRLFLTETSDWWRFTNNDVEGLDGKAKHSEWPVMD